MAQDVLIDTTKPRRIGDNLPPEPIDTSMVIGDPEVLQARLERDHAYTVARFVELELGAKKVPAQITTEQDAATTVEWYGNQCGALIAKAGEAHDQEKKPYLECGRVVDRFFNDRKKHLENVIGPIKKRVQAYYKKKEAEQRQREEAARRLAEKTQRAAQAEAERLATEARKSEAAGDRRTAVQLTQMAEKAESQAAVAAAQATAPPAPVAIRGDYGATAFSVERWTFKPEEIDWSQLPAEYWIPDLEGIQQAINDGARAIPGVSIFQDDRFTIKRC